MRKNRGVRAKGRLASPCPEPFILLKLPEITSGLSDCAGRLIILSYGRNNDTTSVSARSCCGYQACLRATGSARCLCRRGTREYASADHSSSSARGENESRAYVRAN